ncbi:MULTISPECIES: hypothetical protein [Listeria]|uniref:hypothetical protein n=1 Tax=Listeria TaxID=1637 RepID=UPI000B58CD2F|nr:MULTISPECIES: hypothetical protein [Listeria]
MSNFDVASFTERIQTGAVTFAICVALIIIGFVLLKRFLGSALAYHDGASIAFSGVGAILGVAGVITFIAYSAFIFFALVICVVVFAIASQMN